MSSAVDRPRGAGSLQPPVAAPHPLTQFERGACLSESSHARRSGLCSKGRSPGLGWRGYSTSVQMRLPREPSTLGRRGPRAGRGEVPSPVAGFPQKPEISSSSTAFPERPSQFRPGTARALPAWNELLEDLGMNWRRQSHRLGVRKSLTSTTVTSLRSQVNETMHMFIFLKTFFDTV